MLLHLLLEIPIQFFLSVLILVSKLWINRFRWIFCCLRRDEYGQEAFMQVASLLSALFRGTDLVPSG